MQVYIYLRITEDWPTVNLSTLNYWQHAEKHEMIPYWNRYCSITWFEFRQKLKDIAMGAWAKLNLPILYFGPNHPDELLLDVIEDDDFVIPTDDDDWFHPRIEEFVRGHADCDVLIWDSMVCQSVLNYNIHSYSDYHTFIPGPNAFAIRGSYAKRMGHTELLFGHGFIMNMINDAKVKDFRKSRWLSCYNWHPGSMSAMNAIKDYIDLPRLFPHNQPLRNLPSDWCWMNPEYQQFVDAVESLRL